MKKIIKIFIYNLILVIVLFFSANTALAQGVNGGIFDFSKIYKLQRLAISKEVVFDLPPFTTITVPSGSFQTETVVFIYEGNFDKIKALLPKGQSPVASYYVMFRSTKGIQVYPSKPLKIQSVNNFSGSNTFFYPMSSDKDIDGPNKKTWQGNVQIKEDLAVKDPAFIVGANVDIKEDNPALKTNKISPVPSFAPRGKPMNLPSEIILIAGAIVIIVFLVLIVLFRFLRRKRQ